MFVHKRLYFKSSCFPKQLQIFLFSSGSNNINKVILLESAGGKADGDCKKAIQIVLVWTKMVINKVSTRIETSVLILSD